jgi:hypothetical protein
MTVYNQFVSDADDDATKAVNMTRFMKETLNLSASDTVVLRMDIESTERPILQRWLEDPQMVDIVDELFVEIHYRHPSMSAFGWDNFAPSTRDQASYLLASCALKASSRIPGLDAALTMGGFVDPCCITSKLHSSSHLIHLSYWRSSNGFFLQFEVFSLQQVAYHGKLPRVQNKEVLY